MPTYGTKVTLASTDWTRVAQVPTDEGAAITVQGETAPIGGVKYRFTATNGAAPATADTDGHAFRETTVIAGPLDVYARGPVGTRFLVDLVPIV